MANKKNGIETWQDENTWWYNFWKNAGSLKWSDSVVFADDLRKQGYTPKIAAHKVNLYDQDLY